MLGGMVGMREKLCSVKKCSKKAVVFVLGYKGSHTYFCEKHSFRRFLAR